MCVCVCVCVCVSLGGRVGWRLVLFDAGQLALKDSLLSRKSNFPTFGLSILVWQWLHLLAMLGSYRSASVQLPPCWVSLHYCPALKQPNPDSPTPEAHLNTDSRCWRILERYF